MTEPCSRRERKKELTRQAILQAARRLFAERGFQAVTIAEVAEAADVAQQTIFNHFRSKEDLFFGKVDESAHDPATAVANRAPGESVFAALRRQLVVNMQRNCMDEEAAQKAAWIRVLEHSPPLQAREREREHEMEDALTATLQEELDVPLPRLMAGQYVAAKRTVMGELRRRLAAGEQPVAVATAMVPYVQQVFDVLERGLAGIGVRTHAAPAAPDDPCGPDAAGPDAADRDAADRDGADRVGAGGDGTAGVGGDRGGADGDRADRVGAEPAVARG